MNSPGREYAGRAERLLNGAGRCVPQRRHERETIMRKYLGFWLLGLALVTGNAHATFHLWSMSELYSNADGSVQFLELRALASGQQFVAGHSLSASSGGVTHSIEFTHDLPGDSSGRTFLVGTQGFAALGIVVPDFVVPNGFFFQGGGSIIFAEGADSWSHGALPADGTSLNRNGSTGANSPRNFLGQTGSVPASTPTASANVQGLWWNDPDESESGWGLNIAHQGDILFTSWFTYDSDGSGMWLFQSRAEKTTTNTYTGQIFRATGAPFSNYDVRVTPIAPSPVGTGTLTFSDAGHGSFAYTVNGVTQTKQIKRFNFGSPVPTCTQGGSFDTNPNFTDLWRGENAAIENGWGVNVVHQGDILFISWFTYDATGRGMWLYGVPSKTTGATYSGALTRNTGPVFSSTPWNRSAVVPTDVGTVTLSFSGASAGTFTYSLNGVTQTKSIVRNIFAVPATICR
jgi:hypothetical protein